MINNISNGINPQSRYIYQQKAKIAFSGTPVKPEYLKTIGNFVSANSEKAGNLVWNNGKYILEPARQFLAKVFNSKPVQNLAGSASFAAIWSNVILIMVNMTVRPLCVLFEKDKKNIPQDDKEISKDEKSKKAAKIYTATRMFLQEGFGLLAMGAFLLYPIPKHIGLKIGKKLAGAENANLFKEYTVKHVQEILKQNKNFKFPELIEKSFRMGEAITTIAALSFLGPMLNNVAINPFLKMIGVDISNKENTSKTKEA